jgi:hypothetical protein
MKPIPDEWLFPPTLKDATLVQRELAARVVAEDDLGAIEVVGGTDISCRPRAPAPARSRRASCRRASSWRRSCSPPMI